VLDIEMHGTEPEGPDMVCGGTSRILVEPAGDPEPYRLALDLLERGERMLLAKDVATGEIAVMDGAGRWALGRPASPAPAMKALETGHPLLAEGVYYAPLLPREKLLILGGGHVGRALAGLAAGLGFSVTVGDDRESFAEAARFPKGVDTACGSYADIAARFPFDPSTYVVIVSRSHLTDLECVRAILGRPYRYAGFMGSLRKVRMVLAQAVKDGHPQAAVEAIHAPIGLDIEAETPEELAVAIAAELIAVRRGAPCAASSHQARMERRGAP
jgi:xanthine dehydrogenase accessory factor